MISFKPVTERKYITVCKKCQTGIIYKSKDIYNGIPGDNSTLFSTYVKCNNCGEFNIAHFQGGH